MSQENVEIVRRGYEAFNRGDFDAAMALSRPDVEFIRAGIESSLKGREEIRTWMEPDAFAEQRIEPLELWANGDRVLVRQEMFARGAGSGIELATGSWAVWTLDGEGFIARGEMFMVDQEAEALEAAGLEE